MKIEHSDLLCEFISFWFETRVNGVLCYETFLDYNDMTWETRHIETPEISVLRGIIEKSSNELAEEQRIRDVITHHLQNA